MVTVISLGGSIIAPDGVDIQFLGDFVSLIAELLEADNSRQFILVTGGGAPARVWQNAYRSIRAEALDEEADWIGIMATRLNAQLVKALFSDYCTQDVVVDPTQPIAMEGRILIAAGWKPGFSSDYDAVLLAEQFHADRVINLSNIEQVYTGDPKIHRDALPIDAIDWKNFRAMVGDEWIPGKNVPFDPIASRHAEKIGLRVICAAGRNLPNLKNLLEGSSFVGTVIG